MTKEKVSYYTFGCKVNMVETDNIRQKMESKGFSTCKDNADIYIINSCTVTEQADKKMFSLVKRIKKKFPNAVIVLTGCYVSGATIKGETPEIFSFCDIVAGSSDKTKIPSLVENYLENRHKLCEISPHQKGEIIEEMDYSNSDEKTRCYLKIQDGCNQFCSYCIIPFARGRSRSVNLENIKKQAENIAKAGYKEVVLTGINLCCYGQDLQGKPRLVDAIETVAKNEGIERVRLSSLEPELISEEDIKRMADCKKLCPHFHLSLQSGCDNTLKAMNRHYDTTMYSQLVKNLRKHFDNPAITTDIMVGYAGETDEDFEKSIQFAKEIKFASAHVFSYSVRKNTAGEKRTDQISPMIKAERNEKMRKICKTSQLEYNQNMIGKIYNVLFEHDENSDFHVGHAENYVKVVVPKICETMRNRIAKVKITKAFEDYCEGTLVK